MKIHLKRRSRKWFFSFSARTMLLLGVFLLVSNVGYLLAQSLLIDPATLMRTAIGGTDYMLQTNFFVQLRNSAIVPSFAIAIAVFIVLALGHFFAFGPKDMTAESEEDMIPWWNLFERVVHGIMAIVFLILFISGLLITFGRFFGGGGPTLLLRQAHEFSGFVFVPVLLVTVVMWVRHALPKAYDLEWFKHLGGYLGYKGELKSEKFNAGQKVWFWIMAICGVLLSWSGISLYFQAGNMSNLRTLVIVHFFAAIPIMLMFLVHLYMASMGTKGTFMGMINGKFAKKAAMAYHSETPQLQRSS